MILRLSPGLFSCKDTLHSFPLVSTCLPVHSGCSECSGQHDLPLVPPPTTGGDNRGNLEQMGILVHSGDGGQAGRIKISQIHITHANTTHSTSPTLNIPNITFTNIAPHLKHSFHPTLKPLTRYIQLISRISLSLKHTHVISLNVIPIHLNPPLSFRPVADTHPA